MTTFTSGQTVYTENGQECIYVANSLGDHIIRQVFDYENHEPHYGKPIVVTTVFNEPPVPRLNAQVVELEEKLATKRKELTDLNRQLLDINRDQKERMDRLKQHESLKRLDDFLAGKITHMVVCNWGSVMVKPLIQALQREDCDRDLKLLTLYGRTNGDLQWRINFWSDGSGSSTEAYPFTNEEEAMAFAKEYVAEKLADCIDGKFGQNGAGFPVGLPEWSKNAQSYGIHVPESASAMLRDYRTKNLQKAVEDAKKKLASAEADLSAIVEQSNG